MAEGALSFDAWINNSQFKKDLDDMHNRIRGFSDTSVREFSRLESSMRTIGQMAAGYLSFEFASKMANQIIKVRGEFQQLSVAFETMLGSKEKSDKLMGEVVQFASTTPFTLLDTANATKQLIAYGFAADGVVNNLKMLGDVASGVGAPIGDIVYLYGTLQTQGRAYTKDIMQFTGRGIPIIAELAKQFGVTTDKVQGMVEAGKVGFPEVEKAFKSMAGEGGMFYNLMEKQSLTLTGQISNLQDNFDKMLNNLGESSQGVIYGAIGGLNSLVANYDKVLEVLGVIVATYGAYKAAVILLNIATVQDIATKRIVISLEALHANTIGRLTSASNSLSKSLMLNPYAIAAAGLVAMGYALYKVITYHSDLEKATQKANVEIENEKDKASELFATLRAAKQGTDDFKKAKEQLVSTYGQYIPKQIQELSNLNDINIAQKAVNTGLAENIALKSKQELTDSISSKYNEKIQSDKESVIKSIKNKKGVEAAATARYELDTMIAEVKAGTMSGSSFYEAWNAMLGKFGFDKNAQGGPGSYLMSISTELRNFKTETDAADKAFSKFQKTTTKKGTPTEEPKKILNVSEQIASENKTIAEATKKRNELRRAGSTATAEDIDNQTKIIEESQKKLKILTGKDEKAQKTADDKALREKEDRLKAFQTLEEQHNKNMLDIQAERIANMNDSLEKEKAQNRLSYNARINEIENEKADTLKLLNQKAGVKLGSKKEIKSLSGQELEDYNAKILSAKEAYTQRDIASEKLWAEKIKSIWDQVTESRLTGDEREKASVKAKYDQMVVEANHNAVLILAIENERTKAYKQIELNSSLSKIDFQEQLEGKQNELKAKGFNRDRELSKLNFDTWKKYQQNRIDLLKQSSNVDDNQKAQLMEVDLAAGEMNNKLEKEAKLRGEVVDAAKQLSELLIKNLDLTSAESQALDGLMSAASQLAQGNYVGAALNVLMSAYNVGMDVSRYEQRLVQPWKEFEAWVSRTNDILQRYIKIRDEAIGSDKYAASDAAIEQAKKNKSEAEKLIDDLKLSYTVKGDGFLASAGKEIARKVEEISKSLGGGMLKLEGDIKSSGLGFYSWAKGVFSFDLSQLTKDSNGNFTLDNIQKLIDTGVITDEKVIQAVKDYNANLDEIKKLEEDKKQQLTDTMSSSIADSIIEALKSGDALSAASQFASNFEDLMRNAILNAVKVQMLEAPLKEWYNQFSADMESGGGLDAGEIDKLRTWYNQIVGNASDKLNQMYNVAGIQSPNLGSAAASTITGSIKRDLSEETGSELAGLWRKSSDDIRRLVDFNKIAGQYFSEISVNTYNTVEELRQLNSKVDAMAVDINTTAKNTKPVTTRGV